MRIIKPTKIGNDQLMSSSVPFPAPEDGPAWSPTTEYQVGDLVHVASARRRYRAAQATKGVDPSTDQANPPRWVGVAMSRWAMFDEAIGTLSSVEGGPLTVVLRPGPITSLALFDLTGSAVSVVMRDKPGGTVVYERTLSTMQRSVNSFYDWFYEPFTYRYDAIFDGMPRHFHQCEVTLTIQPAGVAAVGECVVGIGHNIGCVEYGVKLGAIDHSQRTFDSVFGSHSLREQRYRKKETLTAWVNAADLDRIYRFLTGIRATLCVFVPSQQEGHGSLIAYGLCASFEIGIDYLTHYIVAMDIESIA